MRYTILRTDIFDKWLNNLRDRQAVLGILNRIARAEAGNFGDVKSVGDGVSEMRIFIGKGYRLYFHIRDNELLILLCGGDKSTQQKDIRKAKDLLKNF